MDSILETIRRTHEEMEALESFSVQTLLNNAKLHKERLLQQHKVQRFLGMIEEKGKYLIELYKDNDGLLKNELNSISTGSDDFGDFYSRLKKIKDYHRRYPTGIARPFEITSYTKDDESELRDLEALFSGDEGMGRYLDLNELYMQYTNLPEARKINYLRYLSEFDHFKSFSKKAKASAAYQQYLESMRSYLESYFARSLPLFDLDSLKHHILSDFEKKWEEGAVPNWPRNGDASNEELFCQACNKQFAKQSLFDSHLTGKKHIKAVAAMEKRGGVTTSNESSQKNNGGDTINKDKATALNETLISRYVQQLSGEVEESKAYVERKQTLTDKERLEDADEEPVEIPEEEEEEEEEDKIYNPLKLPLGWDGKPIPFWLYKLHGLGVEYPCEICGNYVYMGRKAFDRHFQEWRHSYGMKCLGIPNTRQFHDIVKIADAYALAEKLKLQEKEQDVSADITEEYEDDHGNVFNKKTYEDLKRQGLL